MPALAEAAKSENTALIRRAASGDQEAFRLLVMEHQSLVRGLLLRLAGHDQARADELAQEVFITLYERLPSFRFESSLSTWLYQIASRIFLDDCRRKRSRIEELPNDDSIALAIDGNEQPFDRLDLRSSLQRALNSLCEEQRTAIVLTSIEELTHEEAASAMRIPIGTLKTHVSRGKERMRSFLCLNGYEVDL